MTQRVRVSSSAAGLDTLVWPVARLEEGLFCLAQACGWANSDSEPPLPAHHPPAAPTPAPLVRRIEQSAQLLGLEVEAVAAAYTDSVAMVVGAGPALLQLPETGDGPGFLLIVRGHGRWAYLVGNDRSIQRRRPHFLADALWADVVAPRLARVDPLLNAAGVSPQQRSQAGRALLAAMLGAAEQRGGWLLRLPPGAPLRRQFVAARLPRALGLLLVGYTAQLLLTVCAWWLIGRDALSGEFSWASLWAWMLLLLSTLPFLLLSSLAQRQVAVHIGEIFKVRLLQGTLQLQPEEVRHQGAGQFLGRVLAADLVEQVTLAGGLLTLLAVLQLLLAGVILALGAGGWLLAPMLGVWALLLAALSWRYGKADDAYAAIHRTMTTDLVERMVGHRTRLAQEDPVHWHDEEDLAMGRYARQQVREDRAGNRLALLPRSWIAASLAIFAYVLAVQAPAPAQLAIALGGMILAFQALVSMTTGVQSLFVVRSAWREVETLFTAAARPTAAPDPSAVADSDSLLAVPGVHSAAAAPPLLAAESIDFRYADRAQPILEDCSLRIVAGEQILLTGPSGGGKSTLAALLAGLRLPEAGRLTLRGCDRRSVGAAAWRRQVVAVPQFHENYIFTGTLAFNLLLGRSWPPSAADLAAAERTCRELGLSSLLDRMPAGLNQVVGESGWQLSHGEKSRIYVARALLQAPALLILDESFGALDAESLRVTMRCVRQHSATLLVIAHP